jgi:hypothetical protein
MNNYYNSYPPKTSGFAVTSMVLGIIGIPMVCIYFIGIILSILAIIFAGIAISSIKNSNNTLSGKGMAKAGLVLGIINISIVVILILFIIISYISEMLAH